MPPLLTNIKHAWNAFFNKDPTPSYNRDFGAGFSYRPDRPRLSTGNARSIVASIYNRIAIDAANIKMEHVKLDDENGAFKEVVQDSFNTVLTSSANIDQTGKALMRDIIMSMFDEGCVAVVPVDTSVKPVDSGAYDIYTMRTGKITEWYPQHVQVRLYNDRTGRHEEIILSKNIVAIIENPFYAIMNEPNSTLQRLIRKINLLDRVDEQTSSGKLDLIIQLPYVVKSKTRQAQAEERRRDIEMQLAGSKYGIAYIDGTEKITQLNRAVENNIWAEVKELTSMLYNQLGLTENIFNGTAKEEEMINYYNSTIDPILSAIADEFQRKFFTPTAITQGHAIRYFRDPFRLVPVKELAEIADKFTRNEIASSNEIRQVIGWKPSDDPRADELVNANINQSNNREQGIEGGMEEPAEDDFMSKRISDI